MFYQSYDSALNYAATRAPSLDKPAEVIKWAEDICDLLTFIYGRDYDDVTTELYEAIKEEQGVEDEDDD